MLTKKTHDNKDQAIGERAELEAQAQLRIIRALKPLDSHGRQRVLLALEKLLEADALIPGLLAAAGRGLGSPKLLEAPKAEGA